MRAVYSYSGDAYPAIKQPASWSGLDGLEVFSSQERGGVVLTSRLFQYVFLIPTYLPTYSSANFLVVSRVFPFWIGRVIRCLMSRLDVAQCM